MRVITEFDDCNTVDSKLFLTRRSGYEELSDIASTYKLRAVCITEDFINCFAVSRRVKWLDISKEQKH